jgi:PAS domain-containing protein
MSAVFLALLLLALALAISVAAGIALLRRRAADIRLLTEKLTREAEEHRESDERYRLLIKNAPDAIFMLDTHGNFTAINPFWPQTIAEALRRVLVDENDTSFST